MTNKDNGGPAFTMGANEYSGTGPEWGMTLRDYFAAKAMAACIGNMNGNIGVGYEDSNANLSMASYAMADAMLKERAK